MEATGLQSGRMIAAEGVSLIQVARYMTTSIVYHDQRGNSVVPARLGAHSLFNTNSEVFFSLSVAAIFPLGSHESWKTGQTLPRVSRRPN